jgi:hypothetical protein
MSMPKLKKIRNYYLLFLLYLPSGKVDKSLERSIMREKQIEDYFIEQMPRILHSMHNILRFLPWISLSTVICGGFFFFSFSGILYQK